MIDIKELKSISDALDAREAQLKEAERRHTLEVSLLEDKQRTLKAAWSEFKDLIIKLDTHYAK